VPSLFMFEISMHTDRQTGRSPRANSFKQWTEKVGLSPTNNAHRRARVCLCLCVSIMTKYLRSLRFVFRLHRMEFHLPLDWTVLFLRSVPTEIIQFIFFSTRIHVPDPICFIETTLNSGQSNPLTACGPASSY